MFRLRLLHPLPQGKGAKKNPPISKGGRVSRLCKSRAAVEICLTQRPIEQVNAQQAERGEKGCPILLLSPLVPTQPSLRPIRSSRYPSPFISNRLDNGEEDQQVNDDWAKWGTGGEEE